MKIRVYQINMSRDVNRLAFMNYEFVMGHGWKPELYDLVFDGDLPVKTLEGIYALLNIGEKPKGYNGHSLSVSDIVELIDGDKSEFHYCDSFGWKTIAFDTTKVLQKDELTEGDLEDCLGYRTYYGHRKYDSNYIANKLI